MAIRAITDPVPFDEASNELRLMMVRIMSDALTYRTDPRASYTDEQREQLRTTQVEATKLLQALWPPEDANV